MTLNQACKHWCRLPLFFMFPNLDVVNRHKENNILFPIIAHIGACIFALLLLLFSFSFLFQKGKKKKKEKKRRHSRDWELVHCLYLMDILLHLGGIYIRVMLTINMVYVGFVILGSERAFHLLLG